jgi:hypothetical protein
MQFLPNNVKIRKTVSCKVSIYCIQKTSTLQNTDLVAIYTFYMKRSLAWCPFNKTQGPIISHDAQCDIGNAVEICARTLRGKMT